MITTEEIWNLKERCARYKSRSDLKYGNYSLWATVKRLQLEEICFAHMPVFRRIWDTETLVREAAKFKGRTRTEMLAENPALYSALARRPNLSHLLPPSRQGQKANKK